VIETVFSSLGFLKRPFIGDVPFQSSLPRTTVFFGHPRSPMLLNPNARRNPRHISKRSRRVCWLPFPPVDATQCHEFGEDFLLNARNTSDFYGYKWVIIP
jgi:hypothetical protein